MQAMVMAIWSGASGSDISLYRYVEHFVCFFFQMLLRPTPSTRPSSSLLHGLLAAEWGLGVLGPP